MEENKGSNNNENSKRYRSRLSCAECRRLKLRCSRVWPCVNCTRRGCANICPNGIIKGAKPGAQEYKALLKKITNLESIIASIKPEALPQDEDEDEEAGSGTRTPLQNVKPGAPGTLEPRGTSTNAYFGPSAGAGFLEEFDTGEDEVYFEDDSSLGGVTPSTWPILMHGTRQVADFHSLKEHLPPADEARKLIQSYYVSVAYQYEPLPHDEFFNNIFPTIYQPDGQEGGSWTGRQSIDRQYLALIYVMLALGTLFAPDIPFLHPNAAKYYVLSQKCLVSSKFLVEPTLAVIQTLQLHAVYMLNTYKHAAEEIYPILGVAVRTAISMGLHRDGNRWNLSQPELDHRRIVFWEILSFERLTAFALGRPHALSDRHHDTLFPNRKTLQYGKNEYKFDNCEYHYSKWKLCRTIGHVANQAFSTKSPTYETVLKLDREIRMLCQTFTSRILFARPKIKPDIPPADIATKAALKEPDYTRHQMQKNALSVMINECHLFLHRPFFTLALQHPSGEPLQSPFYQSVISVSLESARSLISIARHALARYPHRACRIWSIFFHLYGAGVCHVALLLKCPKSLLAQGCWEDLCEAVELLKMAANEGVLARQLYPRLRQFQKQVLQKLCETYSIDPPETGEIFSVDLEGNVRRGYGMAPSTSSESGSNVASPHIQSAPPPGISHVPGEQVIFPFTKDTSNIDVESLEYVHELDPSILGPDANIGKRQLGHGVVSHLFHEHANRGATQKNDQPQHGNHESTPSSTSSSSWPYMSPRESSQSPSNLQQSSSSGQTTNLSSSQGQTTTFRDPSQPLQNAYGQPQQPVAQQQQQQQQQQQPQPQPQQYDQYLMPQQQPQEVPPYASPQSVSGKTSPLQNYPVTSVPHVPSHPSNLHQEQHVNRGYTSDQPQTPHGSLLQPPMQGSLQSRRVQDQTSSSQQVGAPPPQLSLNMAGLDSSRVPKSLATPQARENEQVNPLEAYSFQNDPTQPLSYLQTQSIPPNTFFSSQGESSQPQNALYSNPENNGVINLLGATNNNWMLDNPQIPEIKNEEMMMGLSLQSSNLGLNTSDDNNMAQYNNDPNYFGDPYREFGGSGFDQNMDETMNVSFYDNILNSV